MNPDERAELLDLCQRILKEQDHEKFSDLILQLEVLLEFFHPAEEPEVTSP